MAQNTIEITPNTSSREGWTALWSALKTVCSEYSGLVPISPNTTPSAASARAPRAPWPRAACSIGVGAVGAVADGSAAATSGRLDSGVLVTKPPVVRPDRPQHTLPPGASRKHGAPRTADNGARQPHLGALHREQLLHGCRRRAWTLA